MRRSHARIPDKCRGRLKTAICFSDGLMFPYAAKHCCPQKTRAPLRRHTLPNGNIARAGHSGCQTP
ncbi:hypothetical protein [Kingella potus]|uniref:hypothetical protein n=1 Tax=Kingella potus TaxID=265175 RepID=UPI0011C03E93|nr:hypothetical protein [Kingella potus]UOP00284.1 hypothetical protein LVJ84_10275 [Kingella potus]